MSTESRSGHRILVVEDNAFAVLDIGEMLTERGFCVVGLATTASDAIDKAAAGADLALVDVLLAGRSNGIEAAAVLRDRYGIPSLFITATVPDVAEARMTGLGHLSKPFTDDDLLRSIDAVMAMLEGRKPSKLPANLTLFA
jgi:two-component system, response regulator PdtaR